MNRNGRHQERDQLKSLCSHQFLFFFANARYVSRETQDNGRGRGIPSGKETSKYWNVLTDYLSRLPSTLDRLKPIAERAASGHRSGRRAVVVMVCNYGQSGLLFNFVCSARSRGIDLSNVLLFATDGKVADLARSLNLHVFDVGDTFGEMPEQAAKSYGDKVFAGMMLSKVYCVSLVSQLGFDLLFQDVDMVWHQNPLDFFLGGGDGDGESAVADPEFDIYFQDDGSRSARYAPYSPNTGFYFVRNNERTVYLFNVFLRMGDVIITSRTHQAALNDLISEFASWKGLRVKSYERDSALGRLFPGGVHYHRKKDFMKGMMEKKVEQPYIFHMSWTHNKDNKRLFFQQMGEWYLKPECEDKAVADILNGDAAAAADGDAVSNKCCSAEPLVTCHYRDKPSIIPCLDSPPIDKGRPSFW